MCWGTKASFALAGAGVGAAVYAHKKGLSKGFTLPLIYFSLMELLQGLTYPTLNQCDNPSNQVYTLLGFYHIAFQAFFLNMFMMEFIPTWLKQKIQLTVYILCGVIAIFFLMAAYPFPWAEKCPQGYNITLCGEILCSQSGIWHLAWSVPFNNFDLIPDFQFFGKYWQETQIAYAFVFLIMPMLYGAWRICLFMSLWSILADSTTPNSSESAAIWCLFSVICIIICLLPPLREKLKTNNYYGWIPKSFLD